MKSIVSLPTRTDIPPPQPTQSSWMRKAITSFRYHTKALCKYIHSLKKDFFYNQIKLLRFFSENHTKELKIKRCVVERFARIIKNEITTKIVTSCECVWEREQESTRCRCNLYENKNINKKRVKHAERDLYTLKHSFRPFVVAMHTTIQFYPLSLPSNTCTSSVQHKTRKLCKTCSR